MQNPSGIQKIRGLVIALSLTLCPAALVHAEVGVSVGINLGFNLPAYPRLTIVPGYPVYYAPQLRMNYFFYDGLYWVYQNDHWYVSSWYNGPWDWVEPAYVPSFILRIPVRYYRHPPAYFYGWRLNAPPRWSERWGHDWAAHRAGWDHWDRRATPRPAPLPAYQRHYSGNHYPAAVEQQRVRTENYRYQPRERTSQQQWQRNPEKTRTESTQPRAPAQQWRQPQPAQQPPQTHTPAIEQKNPRNTITPQERPRETKQQPQPTPQSLPHRPAERHEKGGLNRNEDRDQDRRP